MDISFELYKVFYYVASTLSFSEASRQLYISQSAVSQSIKSLEQKLGHKLFTRNTKCVMLTPEGETLFRHVEPAVNLLVQGDRHKSLRNTASHRCFRYDLPLFSCPLLTAFSQGISTSHNQGHQCYFDWMRRTFRTSSD